MSESFPSSSNRLSAESAKLSKPMRGDQAPQQTRDERGKLEFDQAAALDPYWKQSSNPSHLRLAYFLYFMPSNQFRTAAIWSELARLGYKWNHSGRASDRLRGIEFGAGPAAGATGVAMGEKYTPIGLPDRGDWALIEQDRATLRLGAEWAEAFFQDQGLGDWGTRTFHRTIDIKQGFLPPTAPKFNVWVMSFFLNELLGENNTPEAVATALLDSWEKHLDDEALVILVEPALKLQSRKLLELRKSLLEQIAKRKNESLKLLLPCLGHQACGALALEGDWCHEEVSWWRPPYFRVIDEMAGLDRKTLPFSYLVFAKSSKSRQEILPNIKGATQRLVSPAHSEGKELEFYICGEEGKRRARYRPKEGPHGPEEDLERGSIMMDAEIRGDVNASRIERFKDRI